MNRIARILTVAMLGVSIPVLSQSYSSSNSLVAAEPGSGGWAGETAPTLRAPGAYAEGPLSRLSFGAGISPLGIQLQAVTNVSRHLNLRGTGNVFNYSTNFTSNGINAVAKLNLVSAGASADIYPFRAGFRLSPGVLFYNGNQLTASTNVPAGTSFTLNGTTYYSANANSATGATPVTGSGVLGLNTNKAAFTMTTGWGNMVPRSGHWSFPFEIGVAFIGAPSVNVNLSGWACYDEAQTECTDISSPTNPIAVAIQGNLATQVAKWTSDLKPLNTYPIISGGLAYSFHIR